MKLYYFIFSALIICITPEKDGYDILEETIQKLNEIKTIEYTSIVDFYPKEKEGDGHYEAKCFFDFSSDDKLVGSKFMIYNDLGSQVFNGQAVFSISEENKTVVYEKKPRIHQLGGTINMQGSILETKILLPQILSDTSVIRKQVKDTIIEKEPAYKFHFLIPEKYVEFFKLESAGGYKDYVYNYEIFVSKTSKLPILVKTGNSVSDQVITSRIKDIEFNTKKSEDLWSIDSFQEEYLMMSQREFYEQPRGKMNSLLGNKAPDFSLSDLNDQIINLSDIKDELILLDFWYRNCGPCMEANPGVTDIMNTYADRGLKVYGIEFITPSKEKLEKYIAAKNITIPTLYGGEEVAKNYGVIGAPTFFLLNKEKRVVYAKSGFGKEELINIIEAQLNE